MDFKIWSNVYYLPKIQICHTGIFAGTASQTCNFFNKFAFPYLNYSYSKIHILSKLPIIESSLTEQLNL